jgi:hypothetical protein
MISARTTLLSIAIGVAALIATPAMAGPGGSVATPASESYTMDAAAYAANPVARWDGKIVGRDPDVNVRYELRRDGFADEN